MYIVSTILILNIVGFLGAWQPDIDINRVRLIKNEDLPYKPKTTHSRRSIFTHKFHNDNDYNSSRHSKLRSPVQPPSDEPSSSTEQKTLKVHKPREDPRLFYQSDTYAKEVIGNSLNNEVTAVYPGKDVVRADEQHYRKFYPARLRERATDIAPYDETCVICPHDRTIIAKPGSDRVRLPRPRLMSCHRGYKASRDVKFIPMYGPKFGSLLKKGSYGILGQIKYKNQMLRHCYMTVHVLVQTCALPKYLIAECRDENNTCSFKCRDPQAELRGSASLTCGDDMRWFGQLPACLARKWCEPISPPDHGRVSCKGDTVDGWGLADGAICRVKCAQGWKSDTKPVAICRRGVWSQNFNCTARIG